MNNTTQIDHFTDTSRDTCISCKKGRRDLPDMYAQSPRAALQVTCITSGTLIIKLKPTITLICCVYIKNARLTYVS